jgi:hypothetical protein
MAEFHIKTSESGKLQGPFSSGQLKKLAEQGKLQPKHLVSSDKGASWNAASRFPALEFHEPDLQLEEPSAAVQPISISPDDLPTPLPPSSAGISKKLVLAFVVGGGMLVLLVACAIGMFVFSDGIQMPGTSLLATDTSTPEYLGEAAFNALAQNKKSDFAKLTPEKQELIDVINDVSKVSMSEEKFERTLKGFDRFFEDKTLEIAASFNSIRERAEQDGIDWTTAEFKGIEYANPKKRDGLQQMDIDVMFRSNGTNFKFRLDDCAQINDRWIIWDPMRWYGELKTRGGFSIDDIRIGPPEYDIIDPSGPDPNR